MRLNRVIFLSIISLSFSFAQTTIQYDSGNTSNLFSVGAITGGGGNLFTGLNSAIDVTQVTVFFGATNLQAAHQLRFHESVGGAALSPSFQTVNPSVGMNTFPLTTPANFSGTDIFVRVADYNSGPTLALDVTGGTGNHAFAATGSLVMPTATTANFVLRIRGASGLPVELLELSVE